jgi:uncharacterized protein (TIGR02391 family)
MNGIPSFSAVAIERIARAIAESGTTDFVYEMLEGAGVPVVAESAKWRIVKTSLLEEQKRWGNGDGVVRILKSFLSPQRWADNQGGFERMRAHLNLSLAFNGLEMMKDGTCASRAVATTHDEAAAATSRRLLAELERRAGHAEVFKYCREELVAEDCFNAVFEATKGLAERVRKITGLDLDGHDLVAAALEGKDPIVKLNSWKSITERNEQRGIANLMKGAFSAFRNPSAHEPKVLWPISEADALDLLSTLSLIHRRLDQAVIALYDA